MKKNREEAKWLARLARGIHPEEVPALRVWLKERLNRRIILDMARLWHGADILVLQTAVFSSVAAARLSATDQRITPSA